MQRFILQEFITNENIERIIHSAFADTNEIEVVVLLRNRLNREILVKENKISYLHKKNCS